MAVPYPIWLTFLSLGVLCIYFSWSFVDNKNYKDIVTGLLGMVFFVLCGLMMFTGTGIKSEDMIYENIQLGWFLIGIGIIQGLYTIVGSLDLMGERFNKGDRPGKMRRFQ